MADPAGFLKYTQRETPKRRPVELRLRDWKEVYEDFDDDSLRHQAARCMDCGIPFCHNGCPLGNLIPEWNDQVRRGEWQVAYDRLLATNNFPEFTGRLCPAPCEAACVLGISDDPVTIKQVELGIVEEAFERGLVEPQPPGARTGRQVAVFERSDRPGGLLRYGIPEFKMEKRFLDRRLAQMAAEGTQFRAGVDVGADLPAAELRAGHDAVVLACGAPVPRDLPVP